MALTEKEIARFATFRVEYGCKGAALLRENREQAKSFYAVVLEDIKGSGYRVTKRIHNIVWQVLEEIEDRTIAPTLITRHEVAQIAMVRGNEKKHPVVIMAGHRMRWVGFGWVAEEKASDADKALYPLVVEG